MQSKYHHIQNKILIKIKVSSNKKSLNKIKYQDIVKSQSCQIKISPNQNNIKSKSYKIKLKPLMKLTLLVSKLIIIYLGIIFRQ